MMWGLSGLARLQCFDTGLLFHIAHIAHMARSPGTVGVERLGVPLSFQMDSILPERLLALVRPLRRI